VGAKLEGRRLKLFQIGGVRVRWHRPMEGTPKTVRLVHKAGQWYACFVCEVPESTPLPETGCTLGIDVGISALITTSDGEKVDHPNHSRVAQRSCVSYNVRLPARKRVVRTVARRCEPYSANRYTRRISVAICCTS
jgi:putative transposase